MAMIDVKRSSSNKRVTDPFNEKVRARIFGSYISSSSSSGSEHDGDQSDVVCLSSASPSPCLSYLVQNFLEHHDGDGDGSISAAEPPPATASCDSDSDSDGFRRPDLAVLIADVINPIVWNNADPFRNQLLSHVTRAVEIFSIFRKSNKSVFNRNLMAYLREIGYNAGVCKTRWDSTPGGGLTAGRYEFIDVLRPDSSGRFVVDADFAAEFEIARETENYRTLRNALPRVFVGKSEDLKKILRLMCDEARRSMKINGLTLPPWRKNRYMQAKWLGPYRRTTNQLPAPPAMFPPAGNDFPVKCRSVGFDLAGDSGRLFVPPATRTR